MPNELIRLRDLKQRDLEGTTHASADTSKVFRHAVNEQAPTGWQIQYGDVYIPYEGVGPEYADVRSRRTNEKFLITFFY